MSGLADEAADIEHARKPKPTHPEGWEPGIAWNGRTGTITSRPLAEPTPDWDALLRLWGFDPATHEAVEPVQVRTWDAAIGNGEVRTMWYFRAGIRAKRQNADDIGTLIRAVRYRKPPKASPPGESAFVVPFSDFQLGKRGTKTAVERIVAAIDAHARRLDALRKMGRRIGTVVLPGLGDLGESCDGHYAMQTFEVELDGREQRRLGRQLVMYGVDAFRGKAERLILPAVGGNHGENRKDGKAFTTFGDNADLEIYEGVADACRTNPAAYGHVSFVIPQRDLALTLEIGGQIVGLAHGHQAKRGATAQQRVSNWWSGQAFGERPAGDAKILLTGHNHHLSIVQYAARTHIQVPTLDSGSQWFGETAGMDGPPGMLSLVIGPDSGPLGWNDAYLA